MFYRIIISIIAIIPFFCKATPMLEVISIYNEGKIGDQNQIRGIQNSLKESFKNNIILSEFRDIQIEEIKSHLQNNKNFKLILASGEPGVKFYNSIKNFIDPTNTITAYSSHQAVKDYKTVLSTVNLWALPIHVVREKFSQLKNPYSLNGTTIVPVIGVSHDTTPDFLKKEYFKYKDKFEGIKGEFIIVILGGDAPTEEGDIKYYTAQEAERFGNFIGKTAYQKNLAVLVFNGPRTGQYNKDGKLDKNAHRTEMDHVTKAFKEALLKTLNNDKVLIYDFKYNEASLYKAGLGMASEKGMQVFVPGESTSMISEAIDCLPSAQVVIVENSAMNDMHKAHVKSVLESGFATIFNYDNKFNNGKFNNESTSLVKSHKTAADIFAEEIRNTLRKKFGI